MAGHDDRSSNASIAESLDSSVDSIDIAKEHLLREDRDSIDLEALSLETKEIVPPSDTGAEYTVATRTKLIYLAGYFTLNLLLTIYNKAVLGGVCCPAWQSFKS